jgi:GntR family transcriptional repressor for pyruvate dehydrogenase complex
MTRILDEQSAEVAAGRTGLAQDAAFHQALAHSTHNRAITRIVTTLVDLLAQIREESLSQPGRPVRSHDDHRHVLAAVEAHDARKAEQAMLAHIVGVERLVVGRDDDRPERPAKRPSS